MQLEEIETLYTLVYVTCWTSWTNPAPLVDIYLLFESIEVQITTTGQTEERQVLGCFHPSAGRGANDILVDDKVS